VRVSAAVPVRASVLRLLALSLSLVLLAGLVDVPATLAVGPASSTRLEARYDVKLKLGWQTRRVHVKTAIDLRNTSGGPVDRVFLNTVAVKHGGLTGLVAKVDGASVRAERSGQTIVVPLGRSLAPDESARVFVGYKARLKTSPKGRAYYFAKLGGVVQMYRWIPWLSRRIPFGTQAHGEPFVTAVSPRVDVRVRADRKLVWATSGRKVRKVGPRTFEFVARNVRDFNLAASPAFRTVRGVSRDGDTTIFAHTTKANGRRLVKLARDELARYEGITGVPYPHPTYRIAETGGGLAMESPALIWIPRQRPASDHPYLVSHETAHQWWYSTVGNDQSTDAFADEALADYYSRKKHLSLRASRCKADRLDREIRAYSSTCYFEVVYVQGARFLDKLRKDFGGAAFNRAVRRYTQANRFKIAGNLRLLEAFRDQMGDGVLPRYQKRFPGIY
jgi:hypothetical protein